MEKNDLSNLVIRKILSVNTIYTTPNSTYKRSFRPAWAIIQKWEGETEYWDINKRRIVSNFQNPVILPYGSTFEWHCTHEGRYSVIEFEADMQWDGMFVFHISNGAWLLDHIKKLERIHLMQGPQCQMELLEGTYHILLNLLHNAERGYTTSVKLQKIQPAIDYMIRNYDKSISNEELSAMTDVSTVYFRKIFTEAYGISPIHYMQRLRIQKAKEMMQSDYGSISNIAHSLGYQNVYHFSKAFKMQTGISPTLYLKLGGNEENQ